MLQPITKIGLHTVGNKHCSGKQAMPQLFRFDYPLTFSYVHSCMSTITCDDIYKHNKKYIDIIVQILRCSYPDLVIRRKDQKTNHPPRRMTTLQLQSTDRQLTQGNVQPFACRLKGLTEQKYNIFIIYLIPPKEIVVEACHLPLLQTFILTNGSFLYSLDYNRFTQVH